jgi:hypothetical protein
MDELAGRVRELAKKLEAKHKGRTIEVRVPPYAAVQLASHDGDGPTHRRGTPPNVVETDPETFVALATGQLTWDEAYESHKLKYSGAHARDVAGMLPVE